MRRYVKSRANEGFGGGGAAWCRSFCRARWGRGWAADHVSKGKLGVKRLEGLSRQWRGRVAAGSEFLAL